MKKFLLTFLVLIAGYLPLAAQDWAPFRMGYTPYFSSGNRVYSLKITDAVLVGADSIFSFNPVVGPTLVGGGYSRSNDNIFGWKMKKTPVGQYRFIFTDSTEAEINPKAAVGIPQLFLQQPYLDITLLSRGTEIINNQSDSVLTYLLSNGDTLQLSKSFGLLRGRSFQSYLQPDLDTSQWELYRLPEAGMGQAPNSALRIFDFQPGDKFLYRFKESYMFIPCMEIHRTVEVLTRTESPFGDTLHYKLKIQRLINQISNICDTQAGGTGSPNGIVLTDLDTINFVVTNSDYPFFQSLSYEYSPFYPDGFVNVNWGFARNLATDRISIGFNGLYHISSSATFGFLSSSGEIFAEGLGLLQSEYYNEADKTSGEELLIAYIKGTETYGNWQPLVLVAEEELTKEQLQVYPNPFTNELNLKHPQQGNAEVIIYNLQGQKIQVLQTNGEANLQLPELPAGLYLLHVTQGKKSYSVKVQKQ